MVTDILSTIEFQDHIGSAIAKEEGSAPRGYFPPVLATSYLGADIIIPATNPKFNLKRVFKRRTVQLTLNLG